MNTRIAFQSQNELKALEEENKEKYINYNIEDLVSKTGWGTGKPRAYPTYIGAKSVRASLALAQHEWDTELIDLVAEELGAKEQLI